MGGPWEAPWEAPGRPCPPRLRGILVTAACGTGSSVARRRALGSKAASHAGFGAFALLDGLSLGFRVEGLGV